ncbi:putative Sugar transporter [Hibiscus syriacus]|uniref:Sugar transporter n=1 Tax=Hibiscus syriacus TaxID=106335 RepID=A0A6A3CFC5_HIBSY|nr:putative Sugar transporter [Hibiscus syriacus]
MEGIDLGRSEYLRTSEYFVPPPETSVACRESYRLLRGEFVTDFDIETSCGYNVEWISEACMNVTSRAQFESLIRAILYQLRYYCTQSLDDSFTCGLCTRKLLIVKEVFLDGIDDDAALNISACSRYPNMYTAAFNHFGPADRATAQCFCTATVPLEGHQRLIVCDLMRNGSLYDHLFGSGKKKLSWPIRLKIALGTARGLAYLHHGAHPAIIHRDIKASNILLDGTFEPKVADFCLAKIKSEGMTHLSTTVAGTLGYVAPEYAFYVDLEMMEFTLHEVLIASISQVMVKCDGKFIRIIVNDTAEDIMPETLYGDSVGLQQVVGDFLLTSVNFTPQGSQLLLVANLTKDRLGQSVHLAHLELRLKNVEIWVEGVEENQLRVFGFLRPPYIAVRCHRRRMLLSSPMRELREFETLSLLPRTTHAGSGVPEALLSQMFISDEDSSRRAAGEETPEVVPLGIVSPVDGSATVGQDVLPMEHVDSFPMDLPGTSEELTVGTLRQRVDQFVDATFSHDCVQDRLSDNVVPSVCAGPEG